MPRNGNENWSELGGLRRALLAVVMRAVICFVIWAGLLYLCMPAVNGAPTIFKGQGVIVGFVVYGLSGGIVGLFFAWVLGTRLTDIAGMVSPLITAMTLAGAWGAVYSASRVVWILRPLADDAWWAGPMTWIGAGVFASALIIRKTMFEE